MVFLHWYYNTVDCSGSAAVFATDLGHELFIAAAVIGNTFSALVEEVATTQGVLYILVLVFASLYSRVALIISFSLV